MIVEGNAAESARSLMTHERLIRIGIRAIQITAQVLQYYSQLFP